MTKSKKKVIGDPIIINGRQLSLSKAIKAGDFIFHTGQIPFKNRTPMTTGSIEEQTEIVIKDIQETLTFFVFTSSSQVI